MLFGVGLGPGDPELLTIRALRVLRSADEVIAPGRIAHRLISGIRGDARLVEFPMDGRRGADVARRLAAELAEKSISSDIAFCCLGDPSVYSTFQHVAEEVRKLNPSVNVEIVPGVPSFTAALSCINLFVDNPLLVATHSDLNASSFAILKVKKPREVAKSIETRFGNAKFWLLERIFMEDERVSKCMNAEDLPEHSGYFSILVGKLVDRGKASAERHEEEKPKHSASWQQEEQQEQCGDGKSERNCEKGGEREGERGKEKSVRKAGIGGAERKVYFVGFGPGDPELLTIKGYKLLSSADLIIYPGSLVSEEFLREFKAEKVNSYGKRLEEITEIIVRAVKEGKRVVRLQSGDPSIYSAVAEQKNELEKRGIACEIVPGVSSIFAAAASLGIELTADAPSVVITRPAGRTLREDEIEKFASLNCTLVILLGVDKIKEIATRVARIRGADEHAAVIFHASRKDEKIITGTLGDIAEKVHEAGIRRTAVIIIGKIKSFKRSFLYGGTADSSEISDNADSINTSHHNLASADKGDDDEERKSPDSTLRTLECGESEEIKKEDMKETEEETIKSGESIKVRETEEAPLEVRTRVNRIVVVGFNRDSDALNEISDILSEKYNVDCVVYSGNWSDFWRNLWDSYDCIVALMPIGAVVRAVSPLMRSKWSDPAVVVVDPVRKHAIPVLGGHHGGNEVARALEHFGGIEAVITTTAEFSEGFVVGVGCRKGVSADEVVNAIQKALAECGISLDDVRAIATAEVKCREKGLIDAVKRLKKPLFFAKSDEINETTEVKPSAAAQRIGLRSVAEACALIFSKRRKIVRRKQVYGNVTVAIAK